MFPDQLEGITCIGSLPKSYERSRLNVLLEILAKKGLENRLRRFDTILISASARNNELKISGTTPPPPPLVRKEWSKD